MPTEKKKGAEDVIEKAALLKRAGFPTAATVVVVLLSTPGFYERFFDTTDEEAKAKAEVAYQLLKAQAEGMERQIAHQGEQLDQLRETLNALLIQRSALRMGVPLTFGGGTPERLPDPEPEPAMEPEPLPAPPPAAAVQLKPLPSNLDALVQQAMKE